MSLAARLGATLGEDAVEEGGAREVDGLVPELSARPADGDALVAALRVLGEEGAAAIVRGGGTRLGIGNAPRRADVLLSTERLTGIDVLDADEGVTHVGAGTSLAVLAAAAEEAGWELPLASPDAGSTVGGAIASATAGPRVLGHGPPRDHVLGLRVAHPSGERAVCGGRVVKNVTGYDLARLHTGAFGTLGVIESAWLRLRPRPEARSVLRAWLSDDAPAFERGARAAALSTARAVVLVDPDLALEVDRDGPGGGRRLLLVELGGAPETLRRDRALLDDVDEAEPEALDALGRLQVLPSPANDLRFRIVAVPARMEHAALPLGRAGASLVAWPGVGFLYARFPLHEGADAGDVDAAFRAVSAAARAGGGSWVLESAPAWSKAGRDVFSDPGPAGALMRAVKERFDPDCVLNPGRFAGGI